MVHDKVAAINDWVRPTTAKEVEQFLGLAGYYRRFVAGFSRTSSILSAMTGVRKTGPARIFDWTEAHQHAFDEIKRGITSEPCLRLPDATRPFVVHTDASGGATGAALMQDFGDGLQPIAFMSKKMNAAEMNYSTRDQELLALIQAVRTWSHYLRDRHFTVHSDHESLQFLHTAELPTRRHNRWELIIADYDFDVKYIRGEKNPVADGLSRGAAVHAPAAIEAEFLATPHGLSRGRYRLAAAATVPPINLEAMIREAAKADRQYKLWLDKATASVPITLGVSWLASKEMRMENGLLYQTGIGHNRLIVPNDRPLRTRILHEMHDGLLSAHFGRDATVNRTKQRFYWSGLDAWVAEYISGCEACQRNKPSNQRPQGMPQPLDIPPAPWLQWTVDFITKLPRTTTGYDTILVVVDKLTKMVVYIPMVEASTSSEVAHLLVHNVVRHHGLPESIVSDRDVRFTSKLWKSMWRQLGTTLQMGTAYHPQSDGQTERANRTLEEALRAFVNSNQTNWDTLLVGIEIAVNTTVNASSKFTPFMLNHGREMRLPVDHALPKLKDSHPGGEEAAALIKTNLLAARGLLLEAQARQTKAASENKREASFKVGDRVWLSMEHLSVIGSNTTPKLTSKFIGPYSITAIKGNAAALQLPKAFRIHNVINFDRLKPYVDGAVVFPDRIIENNNPPAVNQDGDGNGEADEWEVEAVIDKRGKGNRTEYLVKWIGFGIEESTWQKPRDLLRARRMVDEYEAKTAHKQPVVKLYMLTVAPVCSDQVELVREGGANKNEKSLMNYFPVNSSSSSTNTNCDDDDDIASISPRTFKATSRTRSAAANKATPMSERATLPSASTARINTSTLTKASTTTSVTSSSSAASSSSSSEMSSTSSSSAPIDTQETAAAAASTVAPANAPSNTSIIESTVVSSAASSSDEPATTSASSASTKATSTASTVTLTVSSTATAAAIGESPTVTGAAHPQPSLPAATAVTEPTPTTTSPPQRVSTVVGTVARPQPTNPSTALAADVVATVAGDAATTTMPTKKVQRAKISAPSAAVIQAIPVPLAGSSITKDKPPAVKRTVTKASAIATPTETTAGATQTKPKPAAVAKATKPKDAKVVAPGETKAIAKTVPKAKAKTSGAKAAATVATATPTVRGQNALATPDNVTVAVWIPEPGAADNQQFEMTDGTHIEHRKWTPTQPPATADTRLPPPPSTTTQGDWSSAVSAVPFMASEKFRKLSERERDKCRTVYEERNRRGYSSTPSHLMPATLNPYQYVKMSIRAMANGEVVAVAARTDIVYSESFTGKPQLSQAQLLRVCDRMTAGDKERDKFTNNNKLYCEADMWFKHLTGEGRIERMNTASFGNAMFAFNATNAAEMIKKNNALPMRLAVSNGGSNQPVVPEYMSTTDAKRAVAKLAQTDWNCIKPIDHVVRTRYNPTDRPDVESMEDATVFYPSWLQQPPAGEPDRHIKTVSMEDARNHVVRLHAVATAALTLLAVTYARAMQFIRLWQATRNREETENRQLRLFVDTSLITYWLASEQYHRVAFLRLNEMERVMALTQAQTVTRHTPSEQQMMDKGRTILASGSVRLRGYNGDGEPRQPRCCANNSRSFRCDKDVAHGVAEYCPDHLAALPGLEIKTSNVPNGGLGLFTTRAVAKNTTIALYTGVLSVESSLPRGAAYALIAGDANEEGDELFINASSLGAGVGRMINDPRGTAYTTNVNFHQPSADSVSSIMAQASRDIGIGEELFVAYGEAYWDTPGRRQTVPTNEPSPMEMWSGPTAEQTEFASQTEDSRRYQAELIEARIRMEETDEAVMTKIRYAYADRSVKPLNKLHKTDIISAAFTDLETHTTAAAGLLPVGAVPVGGVSPTPPFASHMVADWLLRFVAQQNAVSSETHKSVRDEERKSWEEGERKRSSKDMDARRKPSDSHYSSDDAECGSDSDEEEADREVERERAYIGIKSAHPLTHRQKALAIKAATNIAPRDMVIVVATVRATTETTSCEFMPSPLPAEDTFASPIFSTALTAQMAAVATRAAAVFTPAADPERTPSPSAIESQEPSPTTVDTLSPLKPSTATARAPVATAPALFASSHTTLANKWDELPPAVGSTVWNAVLALLPEMQRHTDSRGHVQAAHADTDAPTPALKERYERLMQALGRLRQSSMNFKRFHAELLNEAWYIYLTHTQLPTGVFPSDDKTVAGKKHREIVCMKAPMRRLLVSEQLKRERGLRTRSAPSSPTPQPRAIAHRTTSAPVSPMIRGQHQQIQKASTATQKASTKRKRDTQEDDNEHDRKRTATGEALHDASTDTLARQSGSVRWTLEEKLRKDREFEQSEKEEAEAQEARKPSAGPPSRQRRNSLPLTTVTVQADRESYTPVVSCDEARCVNGTLSLSAIAPSAAGLATPVLSSSGSSSMQAQDTQGLTDWSDEQTVSTTVIARPRPKATPKVLPKSKPRKVDMNRDAVEIPDANRGPVPLTSKVALILGCYRSTSERRLNHNDSAKNRFQRSKIEVLRFAQLTRTSGQLAFTLEQQPVAAWDEFVKEHEGDEKNKLRINNIFINGWPDDKVMYHGQSLAEVITALWRHGAFEERVLLTWKCTDDEAWELQKQLTGLIRLEPSSPVVTAANNRWWRTMRNLRSLANAATDIKNTSTRRAWGAETLSTIGHNSDGVEGKYPSMSHAWLVNDTNANKPRSTSDRDTRDATLREMMRQCNELMTLEFDNDGNAVSHTPLRADRAAAATSSSTTPAESDELSSSSTWTSSSTPISAIYSSSSTSTASAAATSSTTTLKSAMKKVSFRDTNTNREHYNENDGTETDAEREERERVKRRLEENETNVEWQNREDALHEKEVAWRRYWKHVESNTVWEQEGRSHNSFCDECWERQCASNADATWTVRFITQHRDVFARSYARNHPRIPLTDGFVSDCERCNELVNGTGKPPSEAEKGFNRKYTRSL